MTWRLITTKADIAPGEFKGFTVGDIALALYNIDGTFYATSNICTHAHAYLSEGYLDGCRVECPLHQGIFNVCTGEALEGPIDEDLRTYPVKLDGENVMVDL